MNTIDIYRYSKFNKFKNWTGHNPLKPGMTWLTLITQYIQSADRCYVLRPTNLLNKLLFIREIYII